MTDIKHFTMSYWLLALTIMFFYNGVFPFVADARFVLNVALTIMFFYNGVFPFVADARFIFNVQVIIF